MSKKNKRADKAYTKAVEELEKDRINEVKMIVKRVLEEIVQAQKERKAADEKLTLLRQDLSDIRSGKIDKIKARHEKAKEEKKSVPFDAKKLQDLFYTNAQDPALRWSGANNLTNLSATAISRPFKLSDGTTVTIA